MSDDALELTRDLFAQHVGSTFRIAVQDGVVEVRLSAVTELRQSASNESFSVEFRGSAAQQLSHHEFHVDHDEIGSFALFMGPVDRDGDELIYEAVFNRVRPKP